MPLRWLSPTDLVLPALPAWPGAIEPASFPEFAAALTARHSAVQVDGPADAAYVAVPTALIQPAVQWTLASLRAQLGRGQVYTVNAFDCEDFTTELCQTLRKILARRGEPRAPLVGRLIVFPTVEWGGIPAGGAHALCGLVATGGPWVIEPQTGTSAPLSAYPNFIARATGF